MLVSWGLITQYLPVVCVGQLVPHVSKYIFNFFYIIILHSLDFSFQTKSLKLNAYPKEREVSIVSEKSTIFMTADEKHKWRLYKGVWRVWWERDVKMYDDFMKLIRQQFREQPTFRDATMYSCSRETKSEKRLQKFHTDDASRHDQSEEPHRSW